MYYISAKSLSSAYESLKEKIENKLIGLLSIMKSIQSDYIKPNYTYQVLDGNIAKCLDDLCYLAKFSGRYGESNLYVKFSLQWKKVVKENFIKDATNVYDLVIFLYKFTGFNNKPTNTELLVRFSNDYHIPIEDINQWFDVSKKEIIFDEHSFSRQECKSILRLVNDTIVFNSPFSVVSRAGELTRAPFIQTLYAGMDGIKCLLILKDDIDTFYSSNSVGKHSYNVSIHSDYRQYVTAIKTKPFLLLAGISGTGKSRIVRELARACWDIDSDEYKSQKPSNFEMVQVKPNWHDSSELIGYVSRINGEKFVIGPFIKFLVKALQNPEVPHFLCLDEMNLAPVEQYFAEYLSVIESRKVNDNGDLMTDPIIDFESSDAYKSLIDQLFTNDDERREYLTKNGGKRLYIPENLIVVGTVNMDETTFSFSRKVLDRAMTIEMNEVNLRGGLTSRQEPIGKLGKTDLIATAAEGVDVYEEHKDVCNIAIAYLEKLNKLLDGTPFKVAYRTRNEFLLYVVNNLPYNKDEQGNDLSQNYVVARALDEITNMKILSRIEGDDTKVKDTMLDELSNTIEEELCTLTKDMPLINLVSVAKLKEIKSRLVSGYTSFWS